MAEKTDAHGLTKWQRAQFVEQLTRIRREILFREGLPDDLPLLTRSQWAALKGLDARQVAPGAVERVRKMCPELVRLGLITMTEDGKFVKEVTARGIKAMDAHNDWMRKVQPWEPWGEEEKPWKGTSALAHTCQIPMGGGKILTYRVADNLGAVQELLGRVGGY